MSDKKTASRNSTLDIIRIIALFTVVSVHFFLHNGFYGEPLTGYGPIEGLIKFFSSHNKADLHGPIMFTMTTMRTLFGVCVPLFIILTGWLMSKKTLSRSYYKGIRKTLIIFVLASVFCMAFKSVFTVADAKAAFQNGDFNAMFEAIKASGGFTFKKYLLSIFDFSGANYSWYIEMYIGLFLIAPFLNLAYNKLPSKRHKQILILTFILLTILPTAFNIYNFDTSTWWTHPIESDSYQKLLPSFWMGFYPVTYYFVGMYLREYGLKLRTRSMILLFIGSLLLFSAFNWFRSGSGGFKTGLYGYWYGFQPFVLSVLLFTLLSRIRTDRFAPSAKTALTVVSDMVLGAYLMSYISDEIVYEQLRNSVPVMTDRLPYYFVCVPISFLMAMGMSCILNALEHFIMFVYNKIKALVISLKSRSNALMRQDILFVVLMAAGVILAFWKCRYGFGGNDEAFYLTIPHRLTLGDVFFTDEWHLSQLSGFLLLPFTWLYTAVTGSTVGIILAARICYIVVHAAASVLIYSRLRKFGLLAAIGTALYFVYTPYDIMALDYDSMGLELVILAGVLLATADYDKKLVIILSGLAFAGAVLCNPYLLSGYVMYALCMVVHVLLKKKDTRFGLKSKMFAPKSFLFFTVGAAALAVIFLVFVLSRTTLSDVFTNLPHMMKDPEHPSIPFFTKVTTYFKTIFECHELFRYAVYLYGATLIAMLFDRKRRRHRSVYLIISAVLSGYTLMLFLDKVHYSTYNAIMFPFIFLTITSYILCEKKPRELFAGLFCLGALYSFCIFATSNQYFYVISMALTASNLAGYVFLGVLLREIRENPDDLTYEWWLKRICFTFIALTIVLQGGLQIAAKVQHVFWEGAPSTLTYEITEGPAKGIYTNENGGAEYSEIYADLSYYQSKPNDNILFLTERTWMYLAADGIPYGTFSAWMSESHHSNLDRLKEYYQLNPGKIPKYIYIPKSSRWDIQRIINEARQNGYVLSESEVGYRLEKP